MTVVSAIVPIIRSRNLSKRWTGDILRIHPDFRHMSGMLIGSCIVRANLCRVAGDRWGEVFHLLSRIHFEILFHGRVPMMIEAKRPIQGKECLECGCRIVPFTSQKTGQQYCPNCAAVVGRAFYPDGHERRDIDMGSGSGDSPGYVQGHPGLF